MTMSITKVIKRFLPKSLLGRSILIIVTPLILLQLVSAFVFYESHWDKVSLRLARGLAGDIAAMVDLFAQNKTPAGRTAVIDLASNRFGLESRVIDGEVLVNEKLKHVGVGIIESVLLRAMNEAVKKPFKIDGNSIDRHVVISVQLPEGVLEIVSNRKRLFSSTTYVFVLWMVGTAMILFGVATIFMRNQVRPIRRLAAAADKNIVSGRTKEVVMLAKAGQRISTTRARDDVLETGSIRAGGCEEDNVIEAALLDKLDGLSSKMINDRRR